MTTYEGFQYMGYLICGVACLAWPFLHFPMWGSMFRGPTEGATEVRLGAVHEHACVCMMYAKAAHEAFRFERLVHFPMHASSGVVCACCVHARSACAQAPCMLMRVCVLPT